MKGQAIEIGDVVKGRQGRHVARPYNSTNCRPAGSRRLLTPSLITRACFMAAAYY